MSKVVPSEPSSRSQYNMSTADRKILTQLEIVKNAHDKEFILKGKGYHQQGGGVTPGKFHHAHDEKKAPYPRCYDARVQDLDVWEIMICHQTCNSWTWHVFKEPPTAVLDIGCGTGSWVTHAAGTWKDCHFWGIDLVPNQPDFTKLGDRDLKERVHWVHANFLEGLPFEDEKFDYIHIKRVGLGVPENKWDSLFEECKRVLKSGGAFELIEEDLFFPGKPNDSNELPSNISTTLEEEDELSSARSSVTYYDSSASHPVSPVATADVSTPISTHGSNPNGLFATLSTSQTPFLPTPSPSEASIPVSEPTRPVAFVDATNHETDAPLPPLTVTPASNNSPVVPVPFVMPHSRSAARPTLSIKTSANPHGSATFALSAVSLIPPVGHNTSAPEYTGSAPRRRSSNVAGLTKDSHHLGTRSRSNSSHGTQSQTSAEGIPAQNGKVPAKREPYLLRQYKAPRNPRDHTILETIYAEMLASRFINATPLSIIQNYLEYHFTGKPLPLLAVYSPNTLKDVRTHPPLLYTFPPTALLHSESRYVTDSETETESSDGFSSDDEEARDAIRPKPSEHKASDGPRSRYRCVLGKPAEGEPDGLRFLTFPHLIRRQSPYVSFDGSRGYAFSPSIHSNRRSVEGKPSGPMRMSRLPNPDLNIDLRTLNMHLYLRTMDILGCSEPMWEWVVQHQTALAKRSSHTNGIHTRGAIRSIQSEASFNSNASAESDDSIMNGIAEMTRDDFEMLLINFELDMQDQASVDYALQEQVNWRVFASPRDHRRKAFDDACKKWDKWVAREERRARRLSRHSHRIGKNNPTPSQESHRKRSNGNVSAPADNADIIVNGQSTDFGVKRVSAKQDSSTPSTVPFSSSSLPPHKRLSRALRVFVAWKSQDPHSPYQAAPTYNGFNIL
ncbi:hypothetical protein D9756_004915 [Leucocoprinus leucothites]|uniref:Methyltransferase domain-containing protein n=1 Tax=Leucocoprinus leucothites TaxID=201217 RepID=A0A8H5G8N3_9AGAR|nr:hypothetical protein D9756_004915 [Leucoagaricus leucothites]